MYSGPYSYYPDMAFDQSGVEEDGDNYAAGPTVFERHGSRSPYVPTREADPAPAPKPAPEPVVAQPTTVLVFKDGHHAEVRNYAIVSETLFDFGEGRSRKIQLADLDLPATQKANDDRGVDFRVPARAY